jgi:hypothetical protein
LQAEDQALVDAAIDSVLEEPVEEIEAAGDNVEVIEVDDEGATEAVSSLDSREGAAMAKIVRVTPAQVNAAKLKVARSAKTGGYVSSSVAAIANAKRASTTHWTASSTHTSKST